MGQKYRRIEDQKPGPGLARNPDFFERVRLEARVKSFSKSLIRETW